MGEYSYPGGYVEEKKFGTPPINGGSSSTGAFVGFTPRGPVGVATLVTSWTDFVNKFALGTDSPYLSNGYLAYSMFGFFDNGGKRAWVVRATDGTEAKATVTIGAQQTATVFTAKDAGTWANALKIKITANVDEATAYDVVISKNGVALENHVQLSFLAGAKKNFIRTINEESKYVNVATDVTSIETTQLGTEKALAGGLDGLSNVTDANLLDAVNKFNVVDSINILVVPESQSADVIQGADAYANNRKDCVFIAEGELNATLESIQAFKQGINSEFSSLYYPWGEVIDPIGTVKNTKYVPVAGHIAGVYARIDSTRGVFKAPAGTEATVRGLVGLKTVVNDQEQGILNPKGINVIRAFPDTGIVLWGARTTANTYINVRRELNYVMSAILSSTKWAVFEPNNEDLWRKLRTLISGFLRGRYNLGAYQGTSEDQAFFVKCDAELNTKEEIDAGRVNTEVGVAINKPGEFIIFRVGQWDGGGSVA